MALMIHQLWLSMDGPSEASQDLSLAMLKRWVLLLVVLLKLEIVVFSRSD